jgi:TolA-binding protein
VIAGPGLAASARKDYENFSLPYAGRRAPIGPEGVSYSSDRLKMRTSHVRIEAPTVGHQELLFAREAFLAEKRDQAIKLLRQEMDSGYRNNRDNMLLRLGQLYAEKYMELSYLENEVFTQQLDKFQKEKASNPKAAPPRLDNSRSKSYLHDSLSIFYQLEKEYPHHPKIDEILFFIGFVEMESGNGAKGARYLERVIRQYPRSVKFDDAVVYLGDYYFDHQKFRDAIAKYRILIQRNDSALHDYATYKMAWCELNTGEARKALADMKALVKNLAGTSDKAKFNLRDQAIRDLVVFYGEVGNIDEAVDFFTDVVGKEKAIQNLRLIADILRSKAHDDEAIRAYSRLLSENPDALDAPNIQLGIYESLYRLGRNEEAVNNLAAAIEHYGATSDWAKNYPKEKAADLKATLDTLQSEGKRAAFFYHAAAQKTSKSIDYVYALRLYSALLKCFPDHPDRKTIAFYRAEILFNQQKWLDAADSYIYASKIPPKDKLTDEAVYDALLALDRLTAKVETIERMSKDEQKNVDLTPKGIPEGEQRFIDVAQFYIKEYPQGARIVDVQFRIAAIYYRYHHYDEALAIFKDIALKHPTHRAATTAANIALDIYNMKKDYDSLDATATLFAHTQGLGDAAFKADMAQISGQIGFKKIETLEAQNKWTDAGDAYLKVYQTNPNGSLAEKSLYNAEVSYEKGGDSVKAAAMSRMFIAKFPKSQYTEGLTLSLAKAAEKQYDFDQAQKLYYDFYKKYPKDKEARKALYNAAVFSELTESYSRAESQYNEYLRDKSVSYDERKAIQISLAKIYRKQGKLDQMALEYRRMIRDAHSLDEKLALLGELSRQYERAGRETDKETTLKELLYLYKSSGKDSKNIGPAVQYVGEAAFRAMQPEREKYDKIELRFPPEDLLYLLHRKQKALTKLTTDYDAVVDIGVPDWGVAAMFKKADAYSEFVTQYRGVQIPKKYKGPELAEVQKSLKDIDEKLVKPIETKATEFYQACTAKATEFHVANEYAARCRDRARAKGTEVAEPSGILPLPSYWSTRTLGQGVAKQ